MECAQKELLTTEEYLRQFHRKALRQRIPLSGSMDLTHRCNLKCVHCYVGPAGPSQKTITRELSTSQKLSIIDEITEAGCLNLLLTGGEPLLVDDFPTVYRHARMNGLIVTVFTNGTLVNDEVLELFETFPPHAIEITLHGMSATTFESITGIPGSYDRCMLGIQRLLEHRIPLKLKTVLMTQNVEELAEVERYAKELGVNFRLDAAIFPRLNGDKTPLTHRIDPQTAAELELADDKRLDQWTKYVDHFKNNPVSDLLYQCGAGMTTFHVDPYGFLQPCLMVTSVRYDLKKGKFEDGWNGKLREIREIRVDSDHKCRLCEKRVFCGYCPGFFELEDGSEETPSRFLCSLGHSRFEIIENARIKR